MLLAFFQRLFAAAPSRTSPGQDRDFLTREDFDRWTKKFEQETEWELNEWYEKLSTLHDRIAKRHNRALQAQAKIEGPSAALDSENSKVSVLAHRKPWSV